MEGIYLVLTVYQSFAMQVLLHFNSLELSHSPPEVSAIAVHIWQMRDQEHI